ncbi:MAG TPA: hypothetical protein PKW69_00380 [Niabella sp.]|nr:hypothetical protein [Niabella sp.]
MYLEDTAAYLDKDNKKRILEELHFNAFRTIKSVYLFKHFDDYVHQLESDKNEDKKDVYWNASYYEKLIDYVKISIAFETYNKAILIDKGILVHKIKSNRLAKAFYAAQNSGSPILANDIVQAFGTSKDNHGRIFLNGLTDYFQTIKYSDTLRESYQKIIGLDTDLIHHLRKINENRNRLHFFTDFKGAFEVSRHIKKWRLIMEKSIGTIELPLKLGMQSNN